MWSYRDLTSGDTASYFVDAARWPRDFGVDIVWSPLYTAFYGSFLFLSPDAYAASIGHRLVIVFVSAMLVLAIMRRLLPGSLGWLVAAWWIVLPINFDTLYAVHLFALLLPLAGVLAALHSTSAWARGVALALFATSAVLVRNELIIAAFCWAGVCAAWETYRARSLKRPAGWSLVAAYLVPLAGATLAVSFFYGHSIYKFPELADRFHSKRAMNFGQIYAFNYLQRHGDWHGSPWTNYRDLMRRDFGTAEPGMIRALRSNAPAMARNFLGNLGLLPTSVQLILFNRASGRINPQYVPFHRDPIVAGVLSALAAATIIAGVALFVRQGPSWWWNTWLKERIWGWIALLCLAASALLVATIATPRPAFILNLGVFLMAVVGMSAFAIATSWGPLRRLSFVPLAAVVLIASWPSHYDPSYDNVRGFRGRPLLTAYRRLAPFGETLSRSGTRLLASTFASDLCSYVARVRECKGVGFYPLMAGKPDQASLADWLTVQQVTHLYADRHMLGDPNAKHLVSDLPKAGWQLLGASPDQGRTWQFLAREPLANHR
jgi:hypothetical protein